MLLGPADSFTSRSAAAETSGRSTVRPWPCSSQRRRGPAACALRHSARAPSHKSAPNTAHHQPAAREPRPRNVRTVVSAGAERFPTRVQPRTTAPGIESHSTASETADQGERNGSGWAAPGSDMAGAFVIPDSLEGDRAAGPMQDGNCCPFWIRHGLTADRHASDSRRRWVGVQPKHCQRRFRGKD
jgi:hypothetical protein